MKCERCNNDKVWIGNMVTGGLACEHCLNDDDMIASATEQVEQLYESHGYSGLSGKQDALIHAFIHVYGGGGSIGAGVANPPDIMRTAVKCPGCWNYVDECSCQKGAADAVPSNNASALCDICGKVWCGIC